MANIFNLARQGDSTAIEEILNANPSELENVDVEENSTVLGIGNIVYHYSRINFIVTCKL